MALALLVSLGLAFNLRFDFVLHQNPSPPGSMRFVREVAEAVGDDRVLFILNHRRDNPWRRELLTLPLLHLHGISAVNVVNRPDMPADRLIAGEKEMLAHLKEKYAEPAPGHFDDKICLEVILRNVSIRAGYRFDLERDSGRIVDPFAKPPEDPKGG